MRGVLVSVSNVEVTSVVESDGTEILDPRRWMGTGVRTLPHETCTALASTPNQIMSLGANRRRKTDAKI